MHIVNSRLHNQYLTVNKFKKPVEVLEYFGAMQAQDYYGAQWSLGMRIRGATEQSIETAFNAGEILRTHLMRPTWHFVSPQNIRWILALTAPRVHAYNGYYYRKSGLDKSIFANSNRIIEKALMGGKQCTRDELNTLLKQSKIPTDQLGLSYTIMQAELDGIICSGPRRGKQFTYMLLDERVPPTPALSADEALSKLVKLYFTSHGPATVPDCVWWSGLTAADIRKGIEENKNVLQSEVIGNKTYWFGNNVTHTAYSNSVILLPTYDEYVIAYKDRSAFYEPSANHDKAFENGFWNTIILKGHIVGTWKRTIFKDRISIVPRYFRLLSVSEKNALQQAVQRYADFMGMKAEIVE